MRDLNRPREEAAARELGSTTVSRGTALGFLAGIAFCLAGVPLLEAALRSDDPGWRALLTQLPTECRLEAFEDRLEEGSTVGGRVRPWVQAALTGALGAGNEQVVPGRNGWLFHRPGLDHLTGPPFLDPEFQHARKLRADACDREPQPDPLFAIQEFHADLAARGIDLVVMPTPGKGTVHPERLAPNATNAIRNPSFARFVSTLEAMGVRVFDPAPALAAWRERNEASPAYLAADTHWRPEAMDAVARALAELLSEDPGLGPRPRTRPPRDRVTVRNRGDLTGMLGLPDLASLVDFERVEIRPPRFVSLGPAPVLLLGDSFSNIYSSRPAFAQQMGGETLDWGAGAGLAEQLAYWLGRPVDRIVRNAGGAWSARQELVREVAQKADSGRDALEDVRVVVYQFAERELSVGDWKQLPLPNSSQVEHPVPTRPDAVPLRVRATVVARSALPLPRSVPYRDALFAVHLRDVETLGGDAGTLAEAAAVVYLLGMRDDIWTSAAHLRPGGRIELRLQPWGDPGVQARFGSLNRTELDDLELLVLPTFFGELAE